MALLVIDNYDSFTYNIVELLRRCTTGEIVVLKNDEVNVEMAAKFDSIIISPGAGKPDQLPNISKIISKLYTTKKMLGICLGCQSIATTFGAELKNLPVPQHGQRKKMRIINGNKLFDHIPGEFYVGLYHSWYIEKKSFPSNLIISAESESGMIMAIKHATYNIQGVLFHPESYITEFGRQLMQNWLDM